jgi:hypothetical protein
MRCASFVLCVFSLAACGGGKVRGADAPLSPAAARVEIVSNAKPPCKKIGSAHGVGEDLDDKVADTQASNAAKEEAAKLGGDTIVVVTQSAGAKAGPGGTVQSIDKTVDVYSCPK